MDQKYSLPAWEHPTTAYTIKTRVTNSSMYVRTICLALILHYNYVYATARYPRVIKNHKAFNEKSVGDWTMKLETFYDERSSSGTYCPNWEITYNILNLIVSCALLTSKINRHLCALCRHPMPYLQFGTLENRYRSHVSNYRFMGSVTSGDYE